MSKFHLVVLLSVASCLTLTGCNDAELRQYVSKFDESVQAAKVAVRDRYSSANDFRRDLYVASVRFNKGTSLEVTKDKKPTGLVKYYSDDYIDARILAMDALAKYTEGLAALALSDAPERSKEAFIQMGEEVGALSEQLNRLNKLNSNNPDLKIAELSTPVASLVGIIAEKILTHVQSKAVKASLKDSKLEVQKLCTALEDDLNELAITDQEQALAKLLAVGRTYYNNTDELINGIPTDDTRVGLLSDLSLLGKQQADVSTNNPAKLVRRIRKVHDQIIEFIEPPKKEESQVKQILSSIKSMPSEKKENKSETRTSSIAEQLKVSEKTKLELDVVRELKNFDDDVKEQVAAAHRAARLASGTARAN